MTQESSPPESSPGSGNGRTARLLAPLRGLPLWLVVPLAALLGAGAGGAYGMSGTPQYTATSFVVVVPTEKSDPAAALGFATAYGRVAAQVAVLGDAQVWAGVSVKTLKDSVRTATSPDAPMISVTATSSVPSTAVSMADGVARALVTNGSHLQGSTNVRVLQFSRAVKPTSPVSPSTPLAALVGGCAGGLLGGLGLLVRPKRRYGDDLHAPVPHPATAAQPQLQPQPQPEPQPGRRRQVKPEARPTEPASASAQAAPSERQQKQQQSPPQRQPQRRWKSQPKREKV